MQFSPISPFLTVSPNLQFEFSPNISPGLKYFAKIYTSKKISAGCVYCVVTEHVYSADVRPLGGALKTRVANPG